MNSGIYNNGQYLEKNKNWHLDDSEWKYNQLLEYLQKIEFNNCADVGCGAGKIISLIAQSFEKTSCTGYDVSNDAAKFWTDQYENLAYLEKDFFAETTNFDLIISLDVLEHIEDYYGFIRGLKPRGKFFIFHVPLDMFVLASLTNNYKRKKVSVGHLHYFDKNTIMDVFKDCGYSIMEYKFTRTYKVANTNSAKKLKFLRSISEKILGCDRNSRILGGYSLMLLLN